jgi:hypothetical protein
MGSGRGRVRRKTISFVESAQKGFGCRLIPADDTDSFTLATFLREPTAPSSSDLKAAVYARKFDHKRLNKHVSVQVSIKREPANDISLL